LLHPTLNGGVELGPLWEYTKIEWKRPIGMQYFWKGKRFPRNHTSTKGKRQTGVNKKKRGKSIAYVNKGVAKRGGFTKNFRIPLPGFQTAGGKGGSNWKKRGVRYSQKKKEKKCQFNFS